MRHILKGVVVVAAALSLSGCLAKAVVDVATLPVKAVSKTVDLATTSQSEADEKRGRELRHREARLGELDRNYHKHMDECSAGNSASCTKARAEYAEMEQLRPTLPAEPSDRS